MFLGLKVRDEESLRRDLLDSSDDLGESQSSYVRRNKEEAAKRKKSRSRARRLSPREQTPNNKDALQLSQASPPPPLHKWTPSFTNISEKKSTLLLKHTQSSISDQNNLGNLREPRSQAQATIHQNPASQHSSTNPVEASAHDTEMYLYRASEVELGTSSFLFPAKSGISQGLKASGAQQQE